MLAWVQTHGLLLLFSGWVFSLVTSSMPALPENSGWWSTFAFNAVQAVGANLHKIVQASPLAKQFAAFGGNDKETTNPKQ